MALNYVMKPKAGKDASKSRKPKPVAKPKPVTKPKKRQESFQAFKQDIGKHASFKEFKAWSYSDDRGCTVINRLAPAVSFSPHLILSDARGRARSALRYTNRPDGALEILSIQMQRTAYVHASNAQMKKEHISSLEKQRVEFWNKNLEALNTKRFGKALGMHPSEFILSEFLFRHKSAIMVGKKLVLSIRNNEADRKIYGPLIERFFKKKPIESNESVLKFELNPSKARVKWILEN